jgi:hypothetical protein
VQENNNIYLKKVPAFADVPGAATVQVGGWAWHCGTKVITKVHHLL